MDGEGLLGMASTLPQGGLLIWSLWRASGECLEGPECILCDFYLQTRGKPLLSRLYAGHSLAIFKTQGKKLF
jgi:hypothetical protein